MMRELGDQLDVGDRLVEDDAVDRLHVLGNDLEQRLEALRRISGLFEWDDNAQGMLSSGWTFRSIRYTRQAQGAVKPFRAMSGCSPPPAWPSRAAQSHRTLKMREVLRSNDAVLISFAQSLLRDGWHRLLRCRPAHQRGGGVDRRLPAPAAGRRGRPGPPRAAPSARPASSLARRRRRGARVTAAAAERSRDRRCVSRRRVAAFCSRRTATAPASMPCCWRRQPRSWTGAAQRILDVGAGVGVVGLSVARRVADASVTLVEREPKLAELARGNVERNGLATRVRVIVADVSRRLEDLPELEADAESFDHVLANPPYNAEGAGTVSADALKAAANVMPGGNARALGALHGRHGQARRHGHHHPSCRCAGRGPFGLGRPVRRRRRLSALSARRASRRSACSCRASRAAARRSSCGPGSSCMVRATGSRRRPRRSCGMARR